MRAQSRGGGFLDFPPFIMVGPIQEAGEVLLRIKRGDFGKRLGCRWAEMGKPIGKIKDAAKIDALDLGAEKQNASNDAEAGENGPRPTQPLRGETRHELLVEAQGHEQHGGDRDAVDHRDVKKARRESGPDIQGDEHERNGRQRDRRHDGENVKRGATQLQPVESARGGHAEQRAHQQQPLRNQDGQRGGGPIVVVDVLVGEVREQLLQRKQKDDRGDAGTGVADDLG